jgi:hypothetical protein
MTEIDLGRVGFGLCKTSRDMTLARKREAVSLMDAPSALFVATNIARNRQSDKGMTGDGPDGR